MSMQCSLPSRLLGLRHSWDFLEGRLCQDGGGGLGGGPPLGGGGREGGGFLVLATMSGSTVKWRGGFVGPVESTARSVNETWSKMSAGFCSCSLSSTTTAPLGWLCPIVLVMSGGRTYPCAPADGPGRSEGSGAGIQHVLLVVALSGCSSWLSTSWSSTAGTAGSTGTSWALFSSFGSDSALTSTCSWSNSWTTSPTSLPFWLSSMMLSMIYKEDKMAVN